jgi:hypothetical protein
MELCSLHPFEEASVPELVAALMSDSPIGANASAWPAGAIVEAKRALDLLVAGNERGAFGLTYAFAKGLAARTPSFAHGGVCLTAWEARVDRGIGMLMRPPARLFIDAGLEPRLGRALPIRLDLHRGMMGGAYVPARLMSELDRLLDMRLERSVRRLIEAEADGVAVMGVMIEAVTYAKVNGMALYEAMDVVGPDGDAPGIPTARVVFADKRRIDKPLRARLEQAAKPSKKPGLWTRLTNRGGQSAIDDPRGRGPKA